MNRTTKKISFFICIFTLFYLQCSQAATYYVSPSGNDANNGTSLTTPLKTITKAVSKAINNGDIIYVREGTYNELVSLSKSGITLAAYQSEKPVIDGKTNLPGKDWGSLLNISGNNNTVSGFEIKNSNTNGAYKGGYAVQFIGHHNKVSNINAHHTWEQGVMIHGDYNTFENSSVWQAARRNSTNTGQVTSGWGMGITAARNNSSSAIKPGITSYAIIRGNKVFNNWGEGLSCFAADHCTIEDNITYDNWTVNLYLSDATNSIVQRNIVYVSSNPAIPTRSNSHPGLLLADEISTVPRSANNQVINNFIYNTDIDAFSWTLVPNSGLKNVLIANNTIVNGGLFTGVGGSKNITNVNSEIRNNIISGSDSGVPSNQGITFSNNNWHVPAVPALGKSSSDVVGDPQLVKTGSTAPGALTGDYFKISSSSPAIDAGKPLTIVTQDFFKTPRNVTTSDIGGHELVSSTTPPTDTGGTTPPTDTGGTTLPTDTGGTTLPTDTGGTTPPTDTGGTTPPTDTGGTTPPTDTGGTTPPTDTGGTTPPTDTGGTTPPTDTGGTTPPISGTVYYVSPTGNDANNGILLTTPFKTIAKAITKAVSGDIVYVRAGIYNETVDIRQNGVALTAYQSEKPIIDGGTTLPNKDWGALITLTGNDNTVSGFEVRNSNAIGKYKGGYAIAMMGHHNKVSKMNVHHTWEQGVMIHGDYNTLEDSSVWQAARRNSTNTGQVTSGWGMGVTAARNNSSAAIKLGITSYAVIRNNTVTNNWGEGVGCFAADHCTIEDNKIFDNWTHNLYLSDATNSLVQRNIVYVSSNPAIPTRNNTRPHFLLADEISTVPRSANNQIINNFLYNTDLKAFSWTLVPNSGLKNVLIANNTIVNGGLFTGIGGSQNITNVNSEIRNNIISGSDSAVPSNQGLTFSNNNWNVPVIPALGKSSSDVIGDPQLWKLGSTAPGVLGGNYFKVLNTSPVINAGKSLTNVSQDFFKIQRGTNPEMGGYEIP